jgi:hypothetical protein
MPFNLLQKEDIRRHLGYPTIGLARTVQRVGTGTMGLNIGFNYFDAFGRLEFAMNNCPPTVEASITGFAYGGIGLVGPGPTTGDHVTITLSDGPLGSPQTITATAAANDTNTSFALKLGANGAQNATLQAAGFQVLAPYGVGDAATGAAAAAQPLAEISITCTQTFTMSVTSTGSTGAVITSVPQLVSPQSQVGSNAGTPIILNGFIPILNYLEGAWPGATQNLDTRQAGEWKARPDEVRSRKGLYDSWCQRLGDRLMVPLNPLPVSRFNGGGGGRAVI